MHDLEKLLRRSVLSLIQRFGHPSRRKQRVIRVRSFVHAVRVDEYFVTFSQLHLKVLVNHSRLNTDRNIVLGLIELELPALTADSHVLVTRVDKGQTAG